MTIARMTYYVVFETGKTNCSALVIVSTQLHARVHVHTHSAPVYSMVLSLTRHKKTVRETGV